MYFCNVCAFSCRVTFGPWALIAHPARAPKRLFMQLEPGAVTVKKWRPVTFLHFSYTCLRSGAELALTEVKTWAGRRFR